MRVLMINGDAFPTPSSEGGTANHIFYLANKLAELGCKVDLVSDVDEAADFHSNISIYRTNLTSASPYRFIYRFGFWGYAFKHLMAGLLAYRRARKLLKNNYDLIHAHGRIAPFLISRTRKKTPLIYTVHDDAPTKGLSHYLIYKLSYKLLIEGTARKADYIIVLHSFNQEYFGRLGITGNRNKLISLGIDTDIFKPGLQEKGDYGLFVGSLTQRKGVEHLLRAIAKTKDVSCLIVGDGSENNRLINLAQSLGINNRVRFGGIIREPRKLAETYNGAGFLIIPSIAEGVPLVGLEAMGCALPIIASNLPDLATIVRDGYNGFLVNSGDTDTLAEKLEVLAGDTRLRKQMGERSLAMFKNKYSLDIMAQSVMNLYEETAE